MLVLSLTVLGPEVGADAGGDWTFVMYHFLGSPTFYLTLLVTVGGCMVLDYAWISIWKYGVCTCWSEWEASRQAATGGSLKRLLKSDNTGSTVALDSVSTKEPTSLAASAPDPGIEAGSLSTASTKGEGLKDVKERRNTGFSFDFTENEAFRISRRNSQTGKKSSKGGLIEDVVEEKDDEEKEEETIEPEDK